MGIVLLFFFAELQAAQQRDSVRSERTHPFQAAFWSCLHIPADRCCLLLPSACRCPAPVPSLPAQSSPLSSQRGGAGTRGRHRLRAALGNAAPFVPSPPFPTPPHQRSFPPGVLRGIPHCPARLSHQDASLGKREITASGVTSVQIPPRFVLFVFPFCYALHRKNSLM